MGGPFHIIDLGFLLYHCFRVNEIYCLILIRARAFPSKMEVVNGTPCDMISCVDYLVSYP